MSLRLSCAAIALSASLIQPRSPSRTPIANGDTRTISIVNVHTNESATVTFKRNGYYDAEGLKQLNWLLRDWRRDEPTKMSPRLFDIVWEVHQEAGSQRAVPRRLRLPLAGHQRHAAPPLAPGRRAQPAHARQGDGFVPARRADGADARDRHAAADAAASAITRPPARPSSISMPAASAPGRA